MLNSKFTHVWFISICNCTPTDPCLIPILPLMETPFWNSWLLSCSTWQPCSLRIWWSASMIWHLQQRKEKLEEDAWILPLKKNSGCIKMSLTIDGWNEKVLLQYPGVSLVRVNKTFVLSCFLWVDATWYCPDISTFDARETMCWNVF